MMSCFRYYRTKHQDGGGGVIRIAVLQPGPGNPSEKGDT